MVRQVTDVLIIGAGATGLMAALTLIKAGKHVTILEARDRCGGRIHTINNEYFKEAQLGAEFVHGDLPITLNLLKEAGINYYPSAGEMWHYKKGRFSKSGAIDDDWELLINKLNELKEDVTINDFLKNEFPDEKHKTLREAVENFAAGYDTADTAKASSFALREEWQNEDDGAQHRIEGGYNAIIKYLEDECRAAGGSILLSSVVKEIQWQPGMAKVTTNDGSTYESGKVFIALPLGVLQSTDIKNKVDFNPLIPKQSKALQDMGFGAIIKILLKFKVVFWEYADGIDLKNMSFILSEEVIPTWWTQVPGQSNVLTGWLGGPKAADMKSASNEELLRLSFQSLANIFKLKKQWLKNKLIASEVVNWTTEPFTLGSYAYDTVEASASRSLLENAVEKTIYFAGEYLYKGPAMGTVEAALTSGMNVANKIIKII